MLDILIVTDYLTKGISKIWQKTIVEFCGMTFDGFHLFGGMDTRAKNVPTMFKCVTKLANK